MTIEFKLNRYIRLTCMLFALNLVFLMLIPESSFAFFERRKEQFLTEPSYMILPLPYSIPGIGSGIMVTGLVGNLLDTHLDVYAIGVTGDAAGYIIGLDDIHLISEDA
jgi:hypothetical protein